jgi:hypothetical protein
MRVMVYDDSIFSPFLPQHKKIKQHNTNNTKQQYSPTKPRTFNMVADNMSYTTVSRVVDSWEMMRRIDNFQETAGVNVFRM